MWITIKAENKKFKIPIPIWVLTSGMSITSFILKLKKKNDLKKNELKEIESSSKKNQEYYKYIDMIDFKGISNVFKDLEEYKGLKIVEMKSKDGEEITIQI